MSMFTLAISWLTTSNVPWFMDLTFQVPMQFCSLQHWTLLPSPVKSTTGCCFCFGSVSSFFLELFLHWSPSSIFGIYWRGVHLSVSYLFAFSYCSWGSQGKNTEVVCHSLLQWTMFLSELSSLKIAEKRRETKAKEKRKDIPIWMQSSWRIARRNKKAFLSDQCKEIEENNREKDHI